MAIVDLGQEYVKAADAADDVVTIQVQTEPGMEVIFSAGGVPAATEAGFKVPAFDGVTRGGGLGHAGHIYVRAWRLPGGPVREGLAVSVIG